MSTPVRIHPDYENATGAITSSELCDTAGITYRQLDHWCRSGLLEGMPSGTGHDFPRLFQPRQAVIVQTAARLVHAGFTPRAAARLVNVLELSGDHTATIWTDHLCVQVTIPEPIQ